MGRRFVAKKHLRVTLDALTERVRALLCHDRIGIAELLTRSVNAHLQCAACIVEGFIPPKHVAKALSRRGSANYGERDQDLVRLYGNVDRLSAAQHSPGSDFDK